MGIKPYLNYCNGKLLLLDIKDKADIDHNHNLADLAEKSYNSLDDLPLIYTQDEIDDKLDLKEDKINKGVANGYAPLDSDTTIPTEFIKPEVYQNAGLIAPDNIVTDNGDGTIDLANSFAALYDNAYHSGMLKQYPVSQVSGMQLIDLEENFVKVRYTNGVASYEVSTSNSDINESNIIPVASIIRAGTRLYIMSWRNLGEGLPNKLHSRIMGTDKFGVAFGIKATHTALDSSLQISNGVVWVGGQKHELTNYTSVTDLFDVWCHDSSNEWVQTNDLIALPYGKYDNSTGVPVDVPSDKTALSWIFRYAGVDRNYATMILEDEFFNSPDEAKLKERAIELPLGIEASTVYVGRMISDVNSIISIDNVAKISHTSSTVVAHDALSNIQGNGQIHLSSAEQIQYVAGYDHSLLPHAPADAYSSSETYNKTEVYNKSETYSLSEVDSITDNIIDDVNKKVTTLLPLATEKQILFETPTGMERSDILANTVDRILNMGQYRFSNVKTPSFIGDIITMPEPIAGSGGKVLQVNQGGTAFEFATPEVTEVIDNLTTNDSTKALSAAQGMELDSKKKTFITSVTQVNKPSSTDKWAELEPSLIDFITSLPDDTDARIGCKFDKGINRSNIMPNGDLPDDGSGLLIIRKSDTVFYSIEFVSMTYFYKYRGIFQGSTFLGWQKEASDGFKGDIVKTTYTSVTQVKYGAQNYFVEKEPDIALLLQYIPTHSIFRGTVDTFRGVKDLVGAGGVIDATRGILEIEVGGWNMLGQEDKNTFLFTDIDTNTLWTSLDGISWEKISKGDSILEIGARNYFSVDNFKDNGVFVIPDYRRVLISNLLPNTAYTLSSNIPVVGQVFEAWAVTGDMVLEAVWEDNNTNGFGLNSNKTITSDANGKITISVKNDNQTSVVDGTYTIQLEKGKYISDWRPSPEDKADINGNETEEFTTKQLIVKQDGNEMLNVQDTNDITRLSFNNNTNGNQHALILSNVTGDETVNIDSVSGLIKSKLIESLNIKASINGTDGIVLTPDSIQAVGTSTDLNLNVSKTIKAKADGKLEAYDFIAKNSIGDIKAYIDGNSGEVVGVILSTPDGKVKILNNSDHGTIEVRNDQDEETVSISGAFGTMLAKKEIRSGTFTTVSDTVNNRVHMTLDSLFATVNTNETNFTYSDLFLAFDKSVKISPLGVVTGKSFNTTDNKAIMYNSSGVGNLEIKDTSNNTLIALEGLGGVVRSKLIEVTNFVDQVSTVINSNSIYSFDNNTHTAQTLYLNEAKTIKVEPSGRFITDIVRVLTSIEYPNGNFAFKIGADNLATWSELRAKFNSQIALTSADGTKLLWFDDSSKLNIIGTAEATKFIEDGVSLDEKYVSISDPSTPLVRSQLDISDRLEIAPYASYSASLKLKKNGGELYFFDYTGSTMFRAVPTGATDLYYNKVKKLETTSTGVKVQGTTTSQVFKVSDAYNNTVSETVGYLTLKSRGNEMCIGASDSATTMNINYRKPEGTTSAPTTWYLRDGTSTGWANLRVGRITANEANLSGRMIIDAAVPGDGGWDNCGIILKNNASTAGECAVAMQNSSTGSNYWIQGLNQNATYKWAYGSEFTDDSVKMSLSVAGDLSVGREMHATNFILTSDIRKKENIAPVCFDNISDIEAVSYNLIDDDSKKVMNGYIAQDVQKINNDLVREDEDGMLSLDYIGIHTAKIAKLESENTQLKSALDAVLLEVSKLKEQVKQIKHGL